MSSYNEEDAGYIFILIFVLFVCGILAILWWIPHQRYNRAVEYCKSLPLHKIYTVVEDKKISESCGYIRAKYGLNYYDFPVTEDLLFSLNIGDTIIAVFNGNDSDISYFRDVTKK